MEKKFMVIHEEDFKDVEFCEIGSKSCVCCITLKNGYEISATYCCKPDELEDIDLRREKALERAKISLQRSIERRKQRDY